MKKLTKQEQRDEAYEAYRAKYKKIEGQKYQAWEAYDARLKEIEGQGERTR